MISSMGHDGRDLEGVLRILKGAVGGYVRFTAHSRACGGEGEQEEGRNVIWAAVQPRHGQET